KSTDFRKFNHGTKLGRLNGSRLRGIFTERQVSARTQVIVEIGFENSPQATLVEDHHMVQALAPDGTHESLGVRILPRGSRGRQNFLHPHCASSQFCPP